MWLSTGIGCVDAHTPAAALKEAGLVVPNRIAERGRGKRRSGRQHRPKGVVWENFSTCISELYFIFGTRCVGPMTICLPSGLILTVVIDMDS